MLIKYDKNPDMILITEINGIKPIIKNTIVDTSPKIAKFLILKKLFLFIFIKFPPIFYSKRNNKNYNIKIL